MSQSNLYTKIRPLINSVKSLISDSRNDIFAAIKVVMANNPIVFEDRKFNSKD